MTDATYQHLVGRRLPKGVFTIPAHQNNLLSRAVEAPADDNDVAHPVLAYVATQRGIGIDIGALFRLVDFDIEDGPMLGATEIELVKPLRIGVPYQVTGEIVDIQRKEGERIGSFDILTVRECLRDTHKDAVAIVTNAFILPRKKD